MKRIQSNVCAPLNIEKPAANPKNSMANMNSVRDKATMSSVRTLLYSDAVKDIGRQVLIN